MANANLTRAKNQKRDCFFTQICDIEDELRHYKKHFENKVVILNCDDPEYSNFWKYFNLNFEHLKLKKLIATHYEEKKQSYMLEMYKDEAGVHTQIKTLKQNGDFRSPECLELLKQADICVGNPPFSLYREFLQTLIENNLKFLIMANNNSIAYKEVFPLLKENKMWLGYSANKTMEFEVPADYDLKPGKFRQDEQGRYFVKVPAISWFTNLDIKKRHEDLILYKHYTPEEYPKYDNYDAINVDKVADIPCDYYGVMGVPITFMDKYNPEQFEIIGLGTSRELYTPNKTYQNPKKYFSDGRVVSANEINSTLTYEITKEKIKNVYYKSDDSDKLLFQPYARILIKRNYKEGK